MKKVITISIIVVMCILMFFGILYLVSTNNTTQTFSLHKTNPVNYSKDVNVNTEITLDFTQPLSKKESTNTVEVLPNTYLVKTVNDTTLVLKPKVNLKENTQYVIKISNIESLSGEKIEPITLIFTTGKDTTERTVFIKSLPYQGDGFYLEFDNTTNTFIVTIQKNPYDKYKQNALNYLNSKNINTNTVNVEYRELRFLQGEGAPPG